MKSPITPINPPLNTTVRKTVALLAKAAAADCESALLDWARDRGFAINRTDNRILLELGANRQRKVQHAITLRSQSEITVILLESKAKGHAPSPELDNLLEATDALAHLKPEYIRNQLPAIQDGLAFQRDILRLLRQTDGGLPFILIAPPHAGRSPAFDKVLRESADIDLIRVGNRTARRLRKARLEGFTRGTLLLRRPGHATQLMPCGDNGEGVADAVKMARDSLAASFRTLRPAQGDGDPVPNRHRRFATVLDAVRDAAERTGDILRFHGNALESAGDSLYHDPDWVNAALLALADVSRAWATRQSLGVSWKDAFAERGFDFSPHSSETCLGKHGTDYTFVHQGRRLVAAEHLSRGNKGARNTIRIYLVRLEEERRILVCHIGQHLPTATRGT